MSTTIEIVVFNALLLGGHWDPVASKVGGAGVALVSAYVGNRYWAFRSTPRRRSATRIVLFLAVNVACALLGASIVWASTRFAGASETLTLNAVNVASIALIVVLRFVLYRWLVFPPEENAPLARPTATTTATATMNHG